MSFIVYQVGPKGAAIAVGLRWVVLQSKADKAGRTKSKSSSSAVRRQGASVRASKFLLNPLDPGVCGFYTQPGPAALKDKAAGGIYSLAALFLQSLKTAAIDDQPCVLLMQPLGMVDKRVLICTDNRLVEVDALLDGEQALEQVRSRLASNRSVRVFSTTEGGEFSAILINWSDIEGLINSGPKTAGALRPLPINPWVPVSAVLTIAACAGFYAHHTLVVKPAEKARLLEEARKQDKTPQYIQLVTQELASAGWDREDLIKQLILLERQPAQVAGWLLEQVQCEQARCMAKWRRQGGTISGLAKALPQHSVVAEESTLSTATTTWPIDSKTVSSSLDKLQSLRVSQAQVFPAFQVLANAGIQAAMNEPQRWGTDLAAVGPSAIVFRSQVEIVGPFFQASEILRMLPEPVYIKSVTVQLGSELRIAMKGSVYVK